jgi:hypothetical protein
MNTAADVENRLQLDYEAKKKPGWRNEMKLTGCLFLAGFTTKPGDLFFVGFNSRPSVE